MLCLFQFLLEDEVIDNTHDNAKHGCTGRRKADLGQTGIWLNALIAGKRQSDRKGLQDAGNHDEEALIMTIVIAVELNSTAVTMASGAKPFR